MTAEGRPGDDVANDRPLHVPAGIRWSDHAGKLFVAPPFIASVISTGLLVTGGLLAQQFTWAESTFAVATLIINPVLAIAASTVAGSLVCGTLGDKVYAAIGGAIFASFAYTLTTGGLYVLVSAVMRWMSRT